MKNLRNIRSALGTAALLALMILGWLFFAPQPLGGPVSYVVTEGISMQPRLTAGDLVVIRESGDYEVGDVVAFRSASLGVVVLHRIIGTDGDRYIFKGDNNDFVDQDRPRIEDLLGKEWFVVVGAGKVLGWVGEPLNAALLAGAISLLILTGFGLKKRSSRGRDVSPPRSRRGLSVGSGSAAPALIAAGLMAVMAVGAALLFGLPEEERSERSVSYTNSGTFSYSAQTKPSPVYRDGVVRTGQPVFLNLVDRLDVRFDYAFATDASHEVSGTGALIAEVADSSGWKRTFVLDKSSEFQGDRASLSGRLDLQHLRKLVLRIQKLTGVQEPFYSVSLTPSVQIDGEIETSPFTDVFAPLLSFELDNLRLKLLDPPLDPLTEEPLSALRPSEQGTVQVPDVEANALKVGGISLPLGAARWALLSGAILAAIALLFLLVHGNGDDEIEAIQRKLSGWIVNVSSISATAERKAIEMSTIDDLAEVANRYDRVILHDHHDGIHSFIVEEDGIAYWYQVLTAEVITPQTSNVSRLHTQRSSAPAPANATMFPGEGKR